MQFLNKVEVGHAFISKQSNGIANIGGKGTLTLHLIPQLIFKHFRSNVRSYTADWRHFE